MMLLELSSFIGRLHPLVVHLPIGFLVLALLFELPIINKRANAVSLIWFFALFFSIVSAILGFLLAQNGHYIEEQLSLHRWSGVVLIGLTALGWMSHSTYFKLPPLIRKINNLFVVIVLIFVGHYGGILTHGQNYLLDYAPEWMKKNFIEKPYTKTFQEVSIDSIYVYQDFVQPLFDQKCTSCHNVTQPRGGLDLTHSKGLFKGGNSGAAIVKNEVSKSLVFNRITRSQSDLKFMPPAGIPMKYDEIQLIEWWINSGASVDFPISKEDLTPEIQELLLKKYKLDTKEKPWYDNVKLNPLEDAQLQLLNQNQFSWRTLASDNPLLDIRYQGKELTPKALTDLQQIAPYVTWLNFSDLKLDKKAFEVISKMENLTRLYLQKSTFENENLTLLSGLKHIEILNLHSTNVNQSVFEMARQLPTLKTLYLWNTKVSGEQIQTQDPFFPSTELIGGLEK